MCKKHEGLFCLKLKTLGEIPPEAFWLLLTFFSFNNLVPATQVVVDDVIEGYYYNETILVPATQVVVHRFFKI